jgi:hypothetical protein
MMIGLLLVKKYDVPQQWAACDCHFRRRVDKLCLTLIFCVNKISSHFCFVYYIV